MLRRVELRQSRFAGHWNERDEYAAAAAPRKGNSINLEADVIPAIQEVGAIPTHWNAENRLEQARRRQSMRNASPLLAVVPLAIKYPLLLLAQAVLAPLTVSEPFFHHDVQRHGLDPRSRLF